ncbi:hypothetical protein [Streptomyces sediminimaris]|uniref:hypothetical protein n=1 Tax=Streptomyces sediminimaris TaxID=3383721 RepID=UPI00399ADB4E
MRLTGPARRSKSGPFVAEVVAEVMTAVLAEIMVEALARTAGVRRPGASATIAPR